MDMREKPDVFKDVHKGLRKALFDLAVQAGATDSGDAGERMALARAAEKVFRFLERHSHNEDAHLIPAMESKDLLRTGRMREDHRALDAGLASLRRDLAGLTELAAVPPAALSDGGGGPGKASGTPVPDRDPAGAAAALHDFYLRLNHFIARYLDHIAVEEREILPAVQAAFTAEELGEFSRKSVAGTPPQDQEMMLGLLFPAMNASEVRAFVAGVRAGAPPAVAARLEGIARLALGKRADGLI